MPIASLYRIMLGIYVHIRAAYDGTNDLATTAIAYGFITRPKFYAFRFPFN
jgi:hypothetical protein